MKRLFKVLVIGGAMLGCTESEQRADAALAADASDGALADANLPDANLPDANLPDTNLADASELALVFCPGDDNAYCPDGEVRPGFECCWGTSC